MNYLGLYNKPKAEVHLGHIRTGSKEEEEEEEEEAEEEEEEEEEKKKKKKNIQKNIPQTMVPSC